MLRTSDIEAYYDSISDGFIGDTVAGKNARHNYVKAVLSEIVKKHKIKSAIDVGCGIGSISKHLAENGCNVTAIDLSKKNIENAKKYNQHSNISYKHSDIFAYKHEIYDLVVLCDVLEHIRFRWILDFCEKVCDMVSDKGCLFLNIPDGRFLKTVPKDKRQIVDISYSIQEVLSLFENNGMEVISIVIYGISAFPQYCNYLFVKKENLICANQ